MVGEQNRRLMELQTSRELLTTLLKQVSRSFYLTLRVLPAGIRPQIGVAYLLARATDTIADTEIIPVETRLRDLDSLRERILRKRTTPLDFGEAFRSDDAERILLKRIEDVLRLLNQCSLDDQQRIREVLQTITSGQALDLRRFAGASTSHIVVLESDQELDDYTHRVAGCVGEFWTRICRAHLFPNAQLDDATLLANGVRFGKGLQLVNILRDFPTDLRQGRCYLPAEQWERFGLDPTAMLEAANEPAFRPLYDRYLTQAKDHLAAGWDYTNALPHRCVRVRLACAWPILIGMKTLQRLRTANVLDVQNRVKVSRPEVRSLIARSVLYYPWPTVWNRLFPRSGATADSRK